MDTTPMAFTIDFGDDDKKDKAPKSLSECVPPKIRKSFRERKEKAKEKKEKEATPNKSEVSEVMSLSFDKFTKISTFCVINVVWMSKGKQV